MGGLDMVEESGDGGMKRVSGCLRYSVLQFSDSALVHGNADSGIIELLLRVGHAIMCIITDLDVESER